MNLIGMKTVTITERGQVAIPKELRGHKAFKEGNKIVVLAYKNRIELRPLKEVEDLFPALASEKSLSKKWLNKEEDKAWKDL